MYLANKCFSLLTSSQQSSSLQDSVMFMVNNVGKCLFPSWFSRVYKRIFLPGIVCGETFVQSFLHFCYDVTYNSRHIHFVRVCIPRERGQFYGIYIAHFSRLGFLELSF